MLKKTGSLLGHVGLGAGAGALIVEVTGVRAIGWLGATCGGVAALPLFATLGALEGLHFFLKHNKRKKNYVNWRNL